MLEKLMLKEGVLKEQSLKYLSRNAGGDLVAQMNKWPGCVELCTAVARLLPHIVQNDAQAVAALKEAGALLALVESLLVVKADTPAVIHNSAKKQRARDAYCGALQSLLPQSSDVANAVDQLMSVHSSEHERLVHELLNMGGAAHIESECLYPSVPVDAPEPSPFVFRTELSEIPPSAPSGFVATEAPALPVVFRADPATPSGEFHFRTAVPALTPSVSPFVFEPASPTPSGGVTFRTTPPVAATTASPFVFGVVPSTPSGGFAFSTVVPALTPLPAKDGDDNGTASAEVPSRKRSAPPCCTDSPVSVKELVLEGNVSAGGSFDRLPSLVRSACLFAATLTFLKCALAY
jgi:hypothetical protein